jgi:serine/threonine protein kinase
VAIAGYKLLDTLGAGACGVVYKASQEKLNRVVALKTVLMPDKASRELLDRFKQEAVSLAKLHHPNIVAVYDGGECDTPKGQVYFAMELLDGDDLETKVARDGPLGERTAWLVARQTAAALAHAAGQGVVHRDIKPANLFLVPQPTGFPLPPGVPMVKVTDFGLALTRGAAERDVHRTAAGTLLGTPVYMAPEQFTGTDVDVRADIYGLGATLYHALSGAAPFDGRTVWEVMMRKSGPPPRLGAPVSPEGADLVAAMMANDASGRPADYAALVARIDALPCLAPEDICSISASGRLMAPPAPPAKVSPAQPPAAPAPRGLFCRSRWPYALAALALVGLGIGIAALAGAFHRGATTPNEKPELPPLPRPPGPPPSAPGKGAKYLPAGSRQLFDGKTVRGWTGRGLSVEEDDEKSTVLTIEDSAAHALRARGNFRVVLSLDRHKAQSVDVVVATSGPAPDATLWLIRVTDKGEATFGKQAKGVAFAALRPVVSLPRGRKNQTPYVEVEYQRAGGELSARFDGRPLGLAPDAGLDTSELVIRATGGPVRIETAVVAELVAQ